MSLTVTLPWPPASLSGHAKGGWHGKAGVTSKHRSLACQEMLKGRYPRIPATGDIDILFRFVPPDRRSDRVNYPNRLKPLIDGIADALGVNDKRFLPSYVFEEPKHPGAVIVTISEVA